MPAKQGEPQISNTNSLIVFSEENCKLIQQQLVLLLHAHRCLKQADHECHIPHCNTMRDLFAHMKQCYDNDSCRVPHCVSSRKIIAHWKSCQNGDCIVCCVLRPNNIAKL